MEIWQNKISSNYVCYNFTPLKTQILKEYRQETAESIYDIIECSLKTVKVPKEWKEADIMPIYKNVNKEEPLDYRTVSLTRIVYKISEKIIKKQWTEY